MSPSLKRVAMYSVLLTALHSVWSAPAGSPSSLAPSIAPHVPSSVVRVVPVSATDAPAPEDPNEILWTEDSDVQPEPMRGSLGSNILGPQNVPLDLQNADMLAPPSTDAGTV